ncbi:DUF5983 family protein [Ferrimonas marina]|uniref:DUF5983 domain-containing protein n=1 Tax=Ferrimonas marina TaxID=299255 RepID=A0A1M5UC57_9GAMM|nr:hypothetical protein [Ferrimonas marina]SHH60539.1 hypothetical protein SAMN02745129_2496 [Ferrimonas marina]
MSIGNSTKPAPRIDLPRTGQILLLSTAHVCPEDYQALMTQAACDKPGLAVYQMDYQSGLIIETHSAHEVAELLDISVVKYRHLPSLLTYAYEQGCSFIKLDNAYTPCGLPQYPWPCDQG